MICKVLPTDAQKQAVWDAYRRGSPSRVPVRLNVNPRIVLMDPALNVDRITFEQAATDAAANVRISLQFQHYLRTVLGYCADIPTTLPDAWEIDLRQYNVGEAAYFGAAVQFMPGQVPSTEPILTEDNRESIFDVPIDAPLENPYIADRLKFWHEMQHICRDLRYEGRPVRLLPWAALASDGPFTVGCNLRGSDLMIDMIEHPQWFDRLMAYLTDAAIARREAMCRYWNLPAQECTWFADDSIAMLGIETYRQRILPHHQHYFRSIGQSAQRIMHLCGNATHLFPLIRQELNVTTFDTGFPVDHGRLREKLGDDVELYGGVEVDLLLRGTPEQVYQRATSILCSGVMRGGRFVLQEANNLPPCCPLENLEAMYAACLEHGWHDR